MVLERFWRPAVAGAILLAATGAASPQRSSLAALNTVEAGAWQLKETGGAARRMCLTNPAALLQLRHPGAQCTQIVIENKPDTATVHYTCPGHGYGRTTVTVETGRLVLVSTQGVADGAPFSSEYEGRKVAPSCN